MRTLLMATSVALCLTLGVAHAQPAATPATEEAVRAAELARFEAMTSNDFAALERILGDDLIYTHSSAAVDTKSAFIEALRSGRTKYQSIEPRDLKIRVYGNTAVITGAGRFQVNANGQQLDNQLRFTDIWVLRDGRWQMVGWQSTRVVESTQK